MLSPSTSHGQPLTLVLEGPIYIEDSLSMRNHLHTLMLQGYHSFVLDLTNVDYIDCSGLGVLVGTKKKLLATGGNLVVTGVSGVVEMLFQLTRLQTFLCSD